MSYEIFALESYTKKIGTIRTSGEVFCNEGTRMGRILSSGEIRDRTCKRLGTVNQSGLLFSDKLETTNYKISRDGTIMYIGEVIGAVKQKDLGIPEVHARWGAFALFYENFVQVEDEWEEPYLEDVPGEYIEPPNQRSTDTMEVEFEPEIPSPSPLQPAAPIKEIEVKVEKEILKTVNEPDLESLEFYAQLRIEAFMKKKKRSQISSAE